MAKGATHRILIESILGGQSDTSHFAARDQFRASIGIDPSQPISDSRTPVTSGAASGLLRPNSVSGIGSTTVASTLWFIPTPKVLGQIYSYDYQGSAYALGQTGTTVSALSDGGSLTNSRGNGAEYYDNYVYFAKNSTIARYGPLDGTAAFDGDYWGTTLGKTYLSDTNYPPTTNFSAVLSYANHVMHRHSDGKLYFADVVGNQGTIHYISTNKTTVEGDTDNGSKYQALQFGYGLWPTAIESYGSDLVIALYESAGTAAGNISGKLNPAKLAFWDTTSASFNKITWVEFPDGIITALKNVDGVLYIISGNTPYTGFRISRFVGGYTVEEVAYIEDGQAPLQGAVDGAAKQLLVGSQTTRPENAPAVFSYGLKKGALGKGLFTPIRAAGDSLSIVSAVHQLGHQFDYPEVLVGWARGSASGTNGICISSDRLTYSSATPSIWWSQVYRIGQHFKITKIRIPLAQAVTNGMTVTATIFVDDGEGGQPLTPIDATSYNGVRNAVFRPTDLTGQQNFFLELRWTGTVLCTVALPITIEYELLED